LPLILEFKSGKTTVQKKDCDGHRGIMDAASFSQFTGRSDVFIFPVIQVLHVADRAHG
jgi:hypothetical protein